jgi:hypothetical protein
MNTRTPAPALVAAVVLTGGVCAQDSQPSDETVSRQEYESLEDQLKSVQADLQSAKSEVEAVKSEQGQALKAGTMRFVLVGDAAAGFAVASDGTCTFSAEFSPLFLWQIQDRLLLEAALDISYTGPGLNGEDAQTDIDLALLNASYQLTDWLILGVGVFSPPFGSYHAHLDPSWINKLPDDPLAFGDDGIAPDTEIGIFGTGAFTFNQDRQRLNYCLYVSNGGTLITEDPSAYGTLNFDNYNDVNGNKAVGGRIGFQPIPELEIGYSLDYAQVNPSGFETVPALLQALDVNYVHEFASLGGRVTARAAWVWSQIGEATYDPTGSLGFGPTRFSNNSNGGYVELAYRPTMSDLKVLRNFEAVLRYDYLDLDTPYGGASHRLTPGLDYWLAPSAVLKFAYQFDSDLPDAFVAQFGLGF